MAEKTKVTTLVFGGLFIVAVGMMVLKERDPAPLAAPAPVKQTAQDARIDFVFDATKAVRAAMRNPESLKWEAVQVNDDATIACLQYRAQNGFGGMNRESVVVVNNAVSKKPGDVKKYCSNPMHDEIAAAR